MLYYDRTYSFEENDVNKTSESKVCDICYYRYLLNNGLMFQLYVCNRFHVLWIMSMNNVYAIFIFWTLEMILLVELAKVKL